MKAELKSGTHTGSRVPPGTTVVEVWYEGKMIGVVYGAGGPGIRFVSKHWPVAGIGAAPFGIGVTEIMLKVEP